MTTAVEAGSGAAALAGAAQCCSTASLIILVTWLHAASGVSGLGYD